MAYKINVVILSLSTFNKYTGALTHRIDHIVFRMGVLALPTGVSYLTEIY